MSEPDVTPWAELLKKTEGPMLRDLLNQRNVLLDAMVRESLEQKERDEAFLASLTPAQRRLELARRRARRMRYRAAGWLEEYVTFRFERRRPRDDD